MRYLPVWRAMPRAETLDPYEGTVRDQGASARWHGGNVAFRFLLPLSLHTMTAALALTNETVIRMTVVEEVEELKLRLENLSGMIPENHPGKIARRDGSKRWSPKPI